MEIGQKIEHALRIKARFPSTRGNITLEDLYDLELLSNDNFDLNTVAGLLDAERESQTKKSYVKPLSKNDTLITLKFEIVEHIISIKQEEHEKAENEADRKLKRKRLQTLLKEKEDEEYKGKSKEDILKELEELDD